ncbi:MAG: sigma 54-interacting transcriptional regulator [Deltaproteobacteria bacterium]|nr:sigma 54-interacting transcriptional regulator [Deltaproteobacteria bacterium]
MHETVRSDHQPRAARVGDYLLVAGKGYFATHVLTGLETTIGRDPSCDIVIEDDELSRRHAVLRLGPPLTIQDLDSTNGTRVGGRPHHGGEPIELLLGGGFEIGPFIFLVGAGDRAIADEVPHAGASLRVDDPSVDAVPPFVRDVAASMASVLILGETGVGKDVLANSLHQLSRRTGEIARINCAALAAPLIESELFGHEKGAFTGAVGAKVGLLESAQGGTVFLDEVGELSPSTQAKLLRAIDSREVTRIGAVRPIPIDVRFIAATNRDLPAEVAAKRFRADLYFRLDGITLVIPPLRERPHRIVPLAQTFLAEAQRAAGRPVAPIALDVAAALEAHDWPGNARELKAVVERALVLARGGAIGVQHLKFSPRAEPPEPAPPAPAPAAASAPAAPRAPTDDGDARFVATLTPEQRLERQQLIDALERCAGNQTRAARDLGISRTTLVNRIQLYRIPRPRA